ncbi:MAG: hypothetical protein MJE77_35505 [Proteobacteria bacterium]|nr:hypothetical protein [Pseudomonadota bacterium]
MTALVLPRQIYTGFNGRDTYRATVTTNFGDLTFSSNNTQVVTAEKSGCVHASQLKVSGVVTARGAGQATLTVTSGSFIREIPVSVTEYTLDQYTVGDTRYNNPGGQRSSCASCHVGANAASHTPVALGGNSDEELIAATKLGKYPDKCVLEIERTPCNCTPNGTDPDNACNACTGGTCVFEEGYTLTLAGFGGGVGDHTMDLTTEEEQGVIAYMRAIPPEGIE